MFCYVRVIKCYGLVSSSQLFSKVTLCVEKFRATWVPNSRPSDLESQTFAAELPWLLWGCHFLISFSEPYFGNTTFLSFFRSCASLWLYVQKIWINVGLEVTILGLKAPCNTDWAFDWSKASPNVWLAPATLKIGAVPTELFGQYRRCSLLAAHCPFILEMLHSCVPFKQLLLP